MRGSGSFPQHPQPSATSIAHVSTAHRLANAQADSNRSRPARPRALRRGQRSAALSRAALSPPPTPPHPRALSAAPNPAPPACQSRRIRR
eukprot:2373381-Rhodomonas_salina.1